MSLITEEQVVLDLTGADRHEATRRLGERLVASGRCTDLDTFLGDVRKREETMATGLPGGIGIPHARSTAITEPSLVFGRSADGIDWGAKDGPATLIFLIAAPEGGGDAHMQMLPKLARALMKKDFKAALAAATTEAEVVRIVSDEVALDQPAAAATADRTGAAAAPAAKRVLNLVGVTSCPTGIAHTYMAAEGLENAAKAAGHTMRVETQGSAGSTPLGADVIAAADAVIFAHDLPVKDAGRFAGKPLVDVGVKKGISDGPALVSQAEQLVAEWDADPSKAAASVAAASAGGGAGGLTSKVESGASTGTKIRQWLMTGVSYMIPFVAAGGILIALSFMLAQVALGAEGPIEIVKYNLTSPDQYNIAQNFSAFSLTSWAALLFVIGGASFGFLVPILSGFIAFAIADRPGLVPGIVGGSIAATMGAGFLGGLATGFLGGFVARWIAHWKVAKGVRGVMPVVVIPLLSTLITAGIFIAVSGKPIKALSDALTSGLNNMSGSSALLLGAPPRRDDGLRPRRPGQQGRLLLRHGGTGDGGHRVQRSPAQDHGRGHGRRHGRAAGDGARHDDPPAALLANPSARTARPPGCSAPRSSPRAPSRSRRPTRCASSPRSVIGSAVTGGLVMMFGATLRAPHGGIWVLPLIGNFLLFLLALVIGVIVMTAIVVALKSRDTHLAEVDASATV